MSECRDEDTVHGRLNILAEKVHAWARHWGGIEEWRAIVQTATDNQELDMLKEIEEHLDLAEDFKVGIQGLWLGIAEADFPAIKDVAWMWITGISLMRKVLYGSTRLQLSEDPDF